MAAASNLHKLNGKDLYDVFGVTVEKGHAEFDTHFRAKKVRSHNWPELNGTEYDLSAGLNLEEKQVTLKCNVVVYSLAEFYTKQTAFLAELRQPGYQQWYIANHDKTYSVKYEDCKDGEKPFGAYRDGVAVVLSFELVLTVQPDLQPGIEADIVVNLNGQYHDTYPAGTKIINITTVGGGQTLEVNITGINVTGNTVTLSATGTPGYDIKFGYTNGFLVTNWQSSNEFKNVPNGTFDFRARLVGTVVEDTLSQTINYTPPAVAETVIIESVSPYQNTLTVSAIKANTTKAIEYTIGGAYQSSSQFANVPNGTYTVTVRLVGTSITDTKSVTVNYTAPADNLFNTMVLPEQRKFRVSYLGIEGSEFHFNSPLPSTDPFPVSMSIFRQGTEIGLVDFPIGGLGQECGVKIDNQLYRFQFTSGRVDV